jgi:hypothetical protein
MRGRWGRYTALGLQWVRVVSRGRATHGTGTSAECKRGKVGRTMQIGMKLGIGLRRTLFAGSAPLPQNPRISQQISPSLTLAQPSHRQVLATSPSECFPDEGDHCTFLALLNDELHGLDCGLELSRTIPGTNPLLKMWSRKRYKMFGIPFYRTIQTHPSQIPSSASI